MGQTDSSLHTIKINLPGGIISAGDLYEILESAEKANVKDLHLGNRQQIYFYVDAQNRSIIERELLTSGINYEIDEQQFPNLVSSYVCAEIYSGTGWLSEGVFKDVLHLFDFNPTLKINLTDPNQSLIPLLTGNLNFIASELSNYWYLYVRFPKTNNIFIWPSLIYTDDIGIVSSQTEKEILLDRIHFYGNQEADGNLLYRRVKKVAKGNWQSFNSQVKFIPFDLPCYEGFHSYKNRLWLGIFRRNELFSISLMKDICLLALKSRLGQLYTSPWKSLIIKGIEPEDKEFWQELLLRHQVNGGHSVNELNWQLEDPSLSALELKKHLVRQLDDADINTAGLSFAIKSSPGSGLFGSIVIRKEADPNQIIERYSIEYSQNFEAHQNFEPHQKENILFKNNLKKHQLGPTLKTLCAEFNNPDRISFSINPKIDLTEQIKSSDSIDLGEFECKHCLTRYEQKYGDPLKQIPAGTPFKSLDFYTCPLCEAPMIDFDPVKN